MNRKTYAAVSIIAALGASAGVAACSSSPSGPPSAQSVLTGNGYTYDASLTSQAQSGLGSTSGASSVAAGEKGSDVQVVIVFTSSAEAAAGATGEQSQLGSGSGISVTSSGDVVTATGSLTAFAAQGS